jgi:hypothetical protein
MSWRALAQLRTMAMSKQLRNYVEAALPPPPKVSDFLKFVEKVMKKEAGEEAPDDKMYGSMFSKMGKKGLSEGKPKGTMKCEDVGARVCLEHAAVQLSGGIEFDSMSIDEWFRGLAKFVIDPAWLFEDKKGFSLFARALHFVRVRCANLGFRPESGRLCNPVLNELGV